MTLLPKLCIMLKISSSEYQHMPVVKFFAGLGVYTELIMNKKPSFARGSPITFLKIDGPCLIGQR